MRPSAPTSQIQAFECRLPCDGLDVFSISALESAIEPELQQRLNKRGQKPAGNSPEKSRLLLRWAIVGTDRHHIMIEGAYLS